MNTAGLMEWWNQLAMAQQVFWSIAIVASVLFFVVFVLSLLGLDADSDVDADLEVDGDIDADGGFSVDPGFSAFSFRSVVAFLTFFGWTGVIMLDGGSTVLSATIGAFFSGLAALFLVAYMLFKFTKLDESGNVHVHMALLREGQVYLTIPAGNTGQGKVHIQVKGALKEWDAKSEGGELKTGTKIKVIDVLEDDVLLVQEIPLLN